jgi:hypothetical protein
MTSPLLAYNFDETGNVASNYGTAISGDISIAGASVTRVPGRTNTGLRSTGSVPAVLPDEGRTAARTIMAWLSIGDAPSSWPLIFNVPSLDSGGWGILYLAPSICVQARNASTFARPSAVWPGGEHHVAGTYDGSAVRLYLDGVLQGAPAALTGPLRTDTDPPKLWSGTGATTAGYIDDVRIYDVALSDAEIAAAMNTPVADLTPEDPPPTTLGSPATGGWGTLLGTLRWNAEQAEAERVAPPRACPHHGDPLEERDGIRHCPMGHFV